MEGVQYWKPFDIATPEHELARVDSKDMRQKILAIDQTDWKNMGSSKGTHH